MNKVKNIKSAPVTVGSFASHLEAYLKTRDLVILPREHVQKMAEALGVFGVAVQILGSKGLLDTEQPIADAASSIEIAKR